MKSHKIRLYPNKKRISYLHRACGVKNWTLNETKKHYKETEKFLSGYDLSKKIKFYKERSI